MPWSQQRSLNKKVCLSRYEKQHSGFAKTQVPSYTIKICKRGHDFPRWPHYQLTFGMHLRHVHVPTSSPCLPPLLGPSCLNPKVGVRFWFGPTQDSSICPMPFDNPICTYTKILSYNLLEVFSLYFTCNLMWYIYVTPCPTKRKVMSSSCSTSLLLLCRSSVEFFYGLLGMMHSQLLKGCKCGSK